MKFKGKTTDDRKGLTSLLTKLHKLETTSVEFGYDNTPHKGSGKTLAELAAIHEYGWYGNPERDFMHQAYIGMQLEYKGKIISDVEEYLYYGGNIVSLYNGFGKLGVSSIKDSIEGGNFAPNSAMTIEIKGSDRPLIDTGQLLNGAKYWVVKGDKV